MGIYDREYYRREGPGFLGSLVGGGQVCKWLIAVNVVFFILQMLTFHPAEVMTSAGDVVGFSHGWFTDALILDPSAVFHGQVWRLLTYAFLHEPGFGIPWHIIVNMLFLWWFGRDMEQMYGRWEFLTMYLTAAFLGGVAYVAYQTGAALLGGLPFTYEALSTLHAPPCLGASGAVMAVLVLCACYYPTRTILLFFIIPCPLWLMVILYVAGDVFGLLGGMRGDIAVVVHLAGAAFAFIYFKRRWRLLDLASRLQSWRPRRTPRPRLRVYRDEEPVTPAVVAAPPARTDVDEHLEAKVDAVLEKVARFGQDSLTDSERQILFRASEVYKRRRS